MIEILTASIADATMLRSLLNIGIANVAIEVHWGTCVNPHGAEKLFFGFHLALLKNEDVCWDGSCCTVSQVCREAEADNEDEAE